MSQPYVSLHKPYVSLRKLNDNYEKYYKNVHGISRRWAGYGLTLKGRITIAKTFLLPQFIYVASVLNPNDSPYENINMIMEIYYSNTKSW